MIATQMSLSDQSRTKVLVVDRWKQLGKQAHAYILYVEYRHWFLGTEVCKGYGAAV